MINKLGDYISLSILLLLFSCNKSDEDQFTKTDHEILETYLNLPSTPYNYASPSLPDFFKNQFVTIQNNMPAGNPVTDWGATLGRVLFYDKELSLNKTISCASCHIQSIGFTDSSILSKGFNGGFTKRHSMALVNATYYNNGRFFWDERAASLEEQVLKPIQDSIEMGLTLEELNNRIKKTPYYPILFNRAFESNTINDTLISKALAQFVRAMVSYQSKYDEGRAMVTDRTSDFPNFTSEENAGKKIFMTNPKVNCLSCHNTDVFIMDNPRNNGITVNNVDEGIFIHTQQILDIGKFKSPSLKNVALRTRYMHDGSIEGLTGVIDHYNSNIKANSNLDPNLINVTTHLPIQMNLSNSEINALKAFLETLTDEHIISDEKFSSPFKK